jgi:hypothetical protein
MLGGILLATVSATAARAGSVIYTNDFETAPPGKEWSADKIDVTPKENRRFLGGFTAEKLTLKLEKLPGHKYVRISLDLYVMGTWSGNATLDADGARIGPDVWRMGVEGRAMPLVNASFSNMDFQSRSRGEAATTQSFPSVLSGEAYPAKTGAAERNTLGYEWASDDGGVRQMDAVYRLSFVVPHEAAEIQFNFQAAEAAEGLQHADEEAWGLDNVKVEALDEADVKKLDETAMRKLWETIGGHDPVAETDAFWHLFAGGDDVARFMRDRVKRDVVDRKQFDKYLSATDGDDFQAREKATQGLKEMGPAIETLLREAIDKADTAELKLRLESALKEIGNAPPADPEMRRRAIALKLLRAIGTAEAIKVAGELSGK